MNAVPLSPRTHPRQYVSHVLVLVALLFGLSPQVCTAAQVWQPSAGHVQLPLWKGPVPDALPDVKPETFVVEREHLVAGQPWIAVQHVSQPTLTVYPPTTTNTGIAVLVFPGGGYRELAIDLEGSEVCEWLASRGITGVLLKYRVPNSGHHWDPQLKRHVQPKAETALEDAQRALGMVRRNAAAWQIDPRKIGVLGFSAGGHLAAALSTHWEKRLYAAVDAADAESCRPDFAAALYPGHLWNWTPRENPNFDLNPDIASHITRDTPPTFLVQTGDDAVDSVNDSLVYYLALKKAGVSVEMHLFANGGHAFGLRRTASPVTGWPSLFESWLEANKVRTSVTKK